MFPFNNTSLTLSQNRGFANPTFPNQNPNILNRQAGSYSSGLNKPSATSPFTNDTNLFARNNQTPNLYQGAQQNNNLNNLLQPNQNIMNMQNFGMQAQMQNV